MIPELYCKSKLPAAVRRCSAGAGCDCGTSKSFAVPVQIYRDRAVEEGERLVIQSIAEASCIYLLDRHGRSVKMVVSLLYWHDSTILGHLKLPPEVSLQGCCRHYR
jgi:hypothetical protein